MAGPDLVIDDFRPGDQASVRALILRGLVEHWGTLDEGLNPDLDDIDAAYGHGRTVVARLDGHILATGTIVPRPSRTAEVLRMSVVETHRRRGLGEAILDELVTTARGWGATELVCETSSAWSGTVAFHRSCGFVVTHHQDGPYGQDTWFRRAI